MGSHLPKPRFSKILQSDMDALASLFNSRLSGSIHAPFTFASGSASQSLWLSELNRGNDATFELLASPSYIYGTTRTLSGILEGSRMPAFWPDSLRTVSGPWIVSPNDNLVEEFGWVFDSVEYWYASGNYSPTLRTVAYRNGRVNFPVTFPDSQTCRAKFRVGGNLTASLSLNPNGLTTGVSFHSVYTGPYPIPPGYTPDPLPTFSYTTDIPGATGSIRAGTFFDIGVISSSISPGIYTMEVTVTNAAHGYSPDWGIDTSNGACGFIGNNGSVDTIYLSVSNNTPTTEKGVSNLGDATVHKLVAPKVMDDGGWPFGVFYTEQGNSTSGPSYVDVVDGGIFAGGPTIALVQKTTIKWDIANTAPTGSRMWVATTVGVTKEAMDIDDRLPFTKTTGFGFSTMRTGSVFNNTLLDPSILYGLGRFPCLAYSASNLTFTQPYGQCIHSVFAHKTPVDLNGNGILLPQLEAQNVEIGFYSGSTFKHLEYITIPASQSFQYADVFWPVFTGTPLCTRVSGSTSASFTRVDCYVNSMLGYTRGQPGINSDQDSRIPFVQGSGFQFPVSHVWYNDTWNRLTAMSASV